MRLLLPIFAGLFACMAWLLIGSLGARAVERNLPANSRLTLPSDLRASFRSPAVTLDTPCSFGRGITFHFTVSNLGTGPSAANQYTLSVNTFISKTSLNGAPWGGVTTLPAVPAHGSVAVDLNVPPYPSGPIASMMNSSYYFLASLSPPPNELNVSTNPKYFPFGVWADISSGSCRIHPLVPYPQVKHS